MGLANICNHINIRHATIATLLLVASWALATFIGHQITEDMYHGTSLDMLNRLIKNNHLHSLDYYTLNVDRAILATHAILAVFVLLFLTSGWQSALCYFLLLVSADVFLGFLSEQHGNFFNIRKDWTLPEIFQYAKEAGIAFFFYRAYSATRATVCAGFSALFAFLLLDDAFRYHETVGGLIAGYSSVAEFASQLTVRPIDIGEVLSLVLPLAIFGPLLILGYMRADRETRRSARGVAYLLAALAVFGVAIDLLDRIRAFEKIRDHVSFIEDMGEMIVMSATFAYAASLMWNSARTNGFRLAPAPR